MTQLQASELYQLKTKVEEAEAEGRDLLAIMAESVQEQITQAYARLSAILQRSTYTYCISQCNLRGGRHLRVR
jgi:hypothetical protein